jgi:hypothetical protein
MRLTKLLGMMAALVAVATVVTAAGAQPQAPSAAWLDTGGTPPSWNQPRAKVPEAPPLNIPDVIGPRCLSDSTRPPETDEDEMLVQAGWILYGSYEAGWGVQVITALSGFDGMCRPIGYQAFVFSNGVFAGTLAPEPMFARTDGSFSQARLLSQTMIAATFQRYSPTDPLCCPSRTSSATYQQVNGAPVVRLQNVSTSPNSPQ